MTTFTPPDQPAYMNVGSLSASGAANAWALGDIAPSSGGGYSEVFRWSSTWRRVSLPAAVVSDSPFSVIGSSSASDVWLLGGRRASAAHWDGSRWAAGALPLVRGHAPTITAGAVLAPGRAWAFGGCCDFPHPYIARLTGSAWQQVALPAAVSGLQAVVRGASAVSSSDIWALLQNRYGDYPKAQLLHWDGHGWSSIGFPAALVANEPCCVVASSPTSVWVGARAVNGSGGRTEVLWHWDGTAWTRYQVPSALAGDLQSFWHVKAITRDGRGGVWVLGQLDSPALDSISYRIWHFAAGQWTGPVWLSPSLPITVSGLAAVPGTTSYFAYGLQAIPPNVTDSLGIIGQYVP